MRTRSTRSRNHEVLFEKRLSWSEKKENVIHIPRRFKDVLLVGRSVEVLVGNEMMIMKIDGRGYMNPQTLLWDHFSRLLDFDEDRDALVFVRYADGVIGIRCKKERQEAQGSHGEQSH